MKLDDLIIELRAKTDQLDASLRRIDGQLSNLGKQGEQAGDGISLGFSKGALRAAAFATAVYTAKRGVDAMVQAGRDMQSLNARMEALTGSASGAREAIAYLSSTAQRQSVDLLQLSDGYARLLPSVQSGALGMGEMRRIIELTNDNMAAMRLTGSDVSLMFYGLSQVLGSGTVTMEDLKQVTERVPGSMQRLAEAMGTNVGGLRDLISTGAVTAQMLKGPLIEALSANEGTAEKMGGTFDAASTRMGNATRELAATIADNSGIISAISGVFDAIAESADWAAERINLLSGNLSKVKLSSLIEELASAKGDLRELNAELADMEGRSGGSPIQQSSRLQGIKELKKQIAEATKEVEDLQKAINDAAGPPVGAPTTKPNTPITPIAPEAIAAQREVERLRKQLEELQNQGQGRETSNEYLKGLADDSKKAAEAMEKAIADRSDEMARQFAQPFENFQRNMQTEFADTFENIFDGSIDSASDAADAMKRIFIKLAAEMAALAIFRPQVLAGGLSGSLGGMTGGGNGASSLVSNGTGLLGKISGITSAIDGFGAAMAPSIFATGAPIGAAVGPTVPGLLGGMGLGLSSLALPVAGFAISSLLSGAFGGSRPHPASSFGTTGTNFNRLNLQSKHMDTSTASGMAGSLQQALAALSGAGLNTSFIQGLQGGVDDGTGFYSFGDWSRRNPRDTVTFDPDDADNGLARFLKLVLDASGDLSGVMDAELIPSLRNLSTQGKTSAEVLDQIITALTRDDLRKTFMEQVNTALLDTALPGYSAMAQAAAEYEANMKRARELGVNQAGLARITALHQANVQRLLEQNDKTQQETLRRAGDLSKRFSDILWSVRNGQYSPLTPSANLDQLRGMVQSAGLRARLGDGAAQEELASLLPQFLELSGSVNGFNAAFEQDRQLTESLAEYQVNVQEAILRQAEKQTDILTRAFGGTTVASGNAAQLFQSAVASGGIDMKTALTILRASGYTGEFIGNNAANFFASDMGANSRALQAGSALGLPQFIAPAAPAAANDNSASIAALRADVQALIRVTAASGQLSADQLAQLNSITQRMARTEELKWA